MTPKPAPLDKPGEWVWIGGLWAWMVPIFQEPDPWPTHDEWTGR